MENLIKTVFASHGYPLNDHQSAQFKQYYDLLIEWNQKINLTAIEEPREVVYKHFIDSALFTQVVPELKGLSLIDVGTGAGFPGVPLKILENDLNLYLLDSLQKRINFLSLLCDNLKLDGVNTIHGRAEDLGHHHDYRGQFDLATARAVAKLPVLLELCLPLLKVGGHFIALKGPEMNDELKESKKALSILGGEITEVKAYTIDNGQYGRTIVMVEKIRETPQKYPRKAGTPQKSSL